MKLQRFEVESYMTLHENNCRYNLADTCAKPLTLKELLAYEKDSLDDLMNLSLDYGAIEGSHELKQGILNLYQTGNDQQIAICHGGVNANELALMTVLSSGDHIISLMPTYQQLYSFPESLGVEVSFLTLKEEDHWKVNVAELEKLIQPNTKMICLNLPNNPTGTTMTLEELQQLITICKKHDLYILVDEIYRGLYGHEPSISDLYEKGISTSGLSKVLSTAGLRMGWIKTPDEELIRLINERRDYSIISSGSLYDYLGTLVLKHSQEILLRNKEILEDNKNYLKNWLQNHPQITCVIPEYGTVCFLKYDYPMDSNTFCEKLQEETGVFFVPGCCFDKEYHLRFGLANDPQIVKEGLEVFSEWLKKLDTSI